MFTRAHSHSVRAAALLAFSLLGCADAEPSAALEAEDLAQVAAPDAGSTSVTIPPPRVLRDANGVAIAEVSANGTGCTRDAWTAELSTDGRTVTATLPSLKAEVTPTTTTAASDCVVSIRPLDESREYAVSAVVATGAAQLAAGMQSNVSLSHWVTGALGARGLQNTKLSGPLAAPFTARIDVATGQESWRRCALARPFNVSSILRVTNAPTRAAGAIGSLAASAPVKVAVTLASRPCSAPSGT